jgi:hypothetical protein
MWHVRLRIRLVVGGNPGPTRRFSGALLLSPGAPYGQARCTFNYVGHLEIPRRTWQVRFFEKKSTTPGAPGDLHRCTWGYQRHHRRTFCDYVRSQGAPIERLHKPLVFSAKSEIFPPYSVGAKFSSPSLWQLRYIQSIFDCLAESCCGCVQ